MEPESAYRITRTDFDDVALRNWWQNAYHSGGLVRDTFFQSWEWNRAWYDHYVRVDARRELVLLRVERAGDIVAAVPLFLQERKAGPITAWRYFLWIADRLAQYPDMVTTETAPTEVWHAVLRFLRTAFPDAWLTLRDVLPDSTAAGFTVEGSERSIGETYLRIDLAEGNEEALLGRCVPHMQREIVRARRMLENDRRLEWRAHRAPSAALTERLIILNRARFGDASWFADPRNRDFFISLRETLGNELLISVITYDGEAVHLMASYLHGGSVHYVLSGMAEEAKRFSPGTMNVDATMRWARHDGFRYFDFLRGDEAYKREFSPEERTSMHLTIPAARGKARRALARAAQRGKSAVEGL